MRENQMLLEFNQPKPIKNLFKMIRVAVDYSDNNKDVDMTQESWQSMQGSSRIGKNDTLSQRGGSSKRSGSKKKSQFDNMSGRDASELKGEVEKS